MLSSMLDMYLFYDSSTETQSITFYSEWKYLFVYILQILMVGEFLGAGHCTHCLHERNSWAGLLGRWTELLSGCSGSFRKGRPLMPIHKSQLYSVRKTIYFFIHGFGDWDCWLRNPLENLDIQQLDWIFACCQVSQLAHRAGLASLAELARLLLEPPPCLTTWPAAAWTVDLVSVRFARPQLLHQWQSAYLAALSSPFKKKKDIKAPVHLTCLTTLWAGQRFDVTSVNQTQISSSLTETN